MTLAALQRVFADVGRAGSAPRVDTSSKCMTSPAVPRTAESHQSRRQMLGVGFAAAALLTAAPGSAAEEKGNRAIRFSGGIKDAQSKRAAREAEMKEKLAAIRASQSN